MDARLPQEGSYETNETCPYVNNFILCAVNHLATYFSWYILFKINISIKQMGMKFDPD